MTMIEDCKRIYSRIEDPRIERNKKHPLMTVILIVLCSCLAGIDNWVGMQDYCEANFRFFKKHFDLSEGVPSHDTIGRVMSLIKADQFEECFFSFTKMLSKCLKRVVAIDGKTARKSNPLELNLKIPNEDCSDESLYCDRCLSSFYNSLRCIRAKSR